MCVIFKVLIKNEDTCGPAGVRVNVERWREGGVGGRERSKSGARPNTFEINGFPLENGIQKDVKCHAFP